MNTDYDKRIEPQISNGIKISSSLKKCSDKLLTNIKDLKDIVDIDTLMPLLKQISDYKCITQYKDPLLYVSYVYDDYGYFKASGYCRLSEYLALTVCDKKFIYSDVLGKHSELRFDMNDLEYEYVSSECSDSEEDDYLELDDRKVEYIKILEDLQKYMYSLPYTDLETYKTSRYNELKIYTDKYIDILCVKH